jgi:hypothetical protein
MVLKENIIAAIDRACTDAKRIIEQQQDQESLDEVSRLWMFLSPSGGNTDVIFNDKRDTSGNAVTTTSKTVTVEYDKPLW